MSGVTLFVSSFATLLANRLSVSRRRVAMIGAVLLTLCCVATAAEAYDYPVSANHAPDDAIDNKQLCPKGEFVTGFTGRVGAWVDRITLRCAPQLASGQMGKPHSVGGQGGGGGGPMTADCDSGVLKQIRFETTAGDSIVLQVTADCLDPLTDVRRTSIFFGSSGSRDDAFRQHCPSNMALTGLRARAGRYLNSLGIICEALKQPCPDGQIRLKGVCQTPGVIEGTNTGDDGGGFIQMFPVGAPRMLFCQGGGMTVRAGSGKSNLLVDFRAAAQSSTAAIPERGECAWQKTAVAANEPKTMSLTLNGADANNLVEAAKNGGIFLIHGTVVGKTIRVDKVDSVNVGFVPGPSKNKSAGKPAKGAGFAAVGGTFDGDWEASADGVGYNMNMTQNGIAVTGDFHGDDGSDGHFTGTVKGRILSFAWKQKDGYGGTGRFTLSGDGGSFSGTYSFGKSAKVSGNWSGRRL